MASSSVSNGTDQSLRPTEEYIRDFREFRSKMKPFSKDEDMKMIHYIVKYGIFSVLKGNTVWKIIEKTVYRHSRTWSSLKDRFHKSVLPRLES